jgi:hypothetical protein
MARLGVDHAAHSSSATEKLRVTPVTIASRRSSPPCRPRRCCGPGSPCADSRGSGSPCAAAAHRDRLHIRHCGATAAH